VLGDVQDHHRSDDGSLSVIEVTEGDQMVGKGADLSRVQDRKARTS
jgi:hypothetical protein